MDPVTHGLLGATVAQVVTGKRLSRGAAFIGALSAMAPDVDVFVPSFGDPTVEWIYHRHITHGLIVIPLGGLLCALPFLLSARFKPYRWAVMLAATLGYATHTMLDSLTNYGTQQLRPFADTRVTWDAMPIVDPLYSLILLAGLLFASRWQNAVRWSLALSLLYVAFGFWQHYRAVNVQSHLLVLRQQKASQARVLPMPGWLIFWRSLYVADGKVHTDGIQVPWFGGARVKRGSLAEVVTLADLPDVAQANAETVRRFKTLEWFAGGYLAQVDGQPSFTIGDQRLTGAIESLRPLWGLRLDAQGVAHHWLTANGEFEDLGCGLFLGDPFYQSLTNQPPIDQPRFR